MTTYLSVAQNYTNSSAHLAEHWLTTSYNVAIFPASYKIVNHLDAFTPSREEVDLAERALSRELWRINKDKRNQNEEFIIHKKLSRYNRQYFGYYNEAKEKVLYITGIYRVGEREENEKNWLNELIKPNQTGGEYWSIEYNVDQNKLFDFYVPQPDKSTPIKNESSTESVQIQDSLSEPKQ